MSALNTSNPQVGKTYGLWKCVDTVASEGSVGVPAKPEAVVS